MKALKQLREQLIKDYPVDTPVFGKAPSPVETAYLFEDLVLPGFEKIVKEFESFHFSVNIRKFTHVVKLEIVDGCSAFSLSVRTSTKSSAVTLSVQYRDYSVNSESYELRGIFEEKYDLSRISQMLPEEMIITIFADTFLSRRDLLKRIVDAELNEAQEKTELLREQRRARLIKLKNLNEKYDPEDEFKKYLDSSEHTEMIRWLDMTYGPFKVD